MDEIKTEGYSQEAHKYAHPINDILFEEDIRAMFARAKNDRERLALALDWVSAGRPEEIARLKKEDVLIAQDRVTLHIQTLKLGRTKGFTADHRNLEFDRPTGLNEIVWLELIIKRALACAPGELLLPLTSRWHELAINRLGVEALGKKISPYHLRHSVLSHKAASGYSIPQLMHFKGAKSAKSVEPYLHLRPFVVKMQNEKLFRQEPTKTEQDTGGHTSSIPPASENAPSQG